ncbi:GNAT family N-acetyltransferase [Actinokineospora soli]|uniref:GNAT family N-acetyltransferase n=1 Tax=Actinokineospora soli TaxID=1048753 RepID=A0ABW2TM41_9PSEU
MPVLTGPALPEGRCATAASPPCPSTTGCCCALDPADADAVRAAFACPDIQRWHVRRIDSADEAAAWVETWPLRWRAETDASWAVAEGDRVVGQVGLRTVDLVEGSARVSYWVVPDARGASVAPARRAP